MPHTQPEIPESEAGGGSLCPGGTTEQGVDPIFARLLSLPGFPLSRWPHWRRWKRTCPEEAAKLALHLATCMRESWEEMRLNPLRVRFLGVLRRKGSCSFQGSSIRWWAGSKGATD
ncbi:hypothetical protein [Desulfoglaeba alkanexedens]|uniref:Uncharacterized protein n=1 Tax=Desulfoglaeba alkanexedens ALDC TaxID=980445 RepID=A0A4V1ER82_9BACT|nr:hypothetical protein [Desulfoglaeba alkanexedens]QCQ20731.1 hypothetical protein FDQ92_00035 [Desulfoglaeba alkanexedens ALDC]